MSARRKSSRYQCRLESLEGRLVLSTVDPTGTTTAAVAATTTAVAATPIAQVSPLSAFQQSVTDKAASTLAVDFVPDGTAVPTGVIGTAAEPYTSSAGYGWVPVTNTSGSALGIVEEGLAQGSTVNGISGVKGEFRVDVPDGTYNVSLMFNDSTLPKGTLDIALDSAGQLGGSLAQGVTTSTLQQWNGQVNVTDGEMTVVLTGPFFLTSMQVTPVYPVTPTPVTPTPVTTPITTTPVTPVTPTPVSTAPITNTPITTAPTSTPTTVSTTALGTPTAAGSTGATVGTSTPTSPTPTTTPTPTPTSTSSTTTTSTTTTSPIIVSAPTDATPTSASTPAAAAAAKRHARALAAASHKTFQQKLGHDLDKLRDQIFGHHSKK